MPRKRVWDMLKVKVDGSEAWLNRKKIENILVIVELKRFFDTNLLPTIRIIEKPETLAEPKLPEPAVQEDKKDGEIKDARV